MFIVASPTSCVNNGLFIAPFIAGSNVFDRSLRWIEIPTRVGQIFDLDGRPNREIASERKIDEWLDAGLSLGDPWHTFASRALVLGKSRTITRKLLGHSLLLPPRLPHRQGFQRPHRRRSCCSRIAGGFPG